MPCIPEDDKLLQFFLIDFDLQYYIDFAKCWS